MAVETGGVEVGMILNEVVPGGSYWSRVIRRGTILRIVDLEGGAGISLLCYNADNPTERYNAADTTKIQFNVFLTKGMLLYSDMGRVLFSITEDTCGHHDTIAGCSTAISVSARYGPGEWRNTRDNFLNCLAKHNLGKKDIAPNLNLFARVQVEPDGALTFVPGVSRPGNYIDLRAEMDVLVVLSNTPHVLDTNKTYNPTPVLLVVLRSFPPGPDDLCRTRTPEAERGFANTDAFFL